VDLSIVNKKALESLIYSGAFDCFEAARSQNFDAIESAIAYGKGIREEKEKGQISMFGESGIKIGMPKLLQKGEWDGDTKLQNEKDVLGFYISGSPLDKYRYEIEGITTLKPQSYDNDDETADWEENNENILKTKFLKMMQKNDTTQTVAGIITDKKVLSSKKDGRPFAFLKIEDIYGMQFDINVWSDKYSSYSHVLEESNIIAVKGKAKIETEYSNDGDSEEDNEAKNSDLKVVVIAEKIISINDAKNYLKEVHVELSMDRLNKNDVEEIKDYCSEQKGECGLFFHFVSQNGRLLKMESKTVKVNNSNKFLDKLKEHTSVTSVWLSK
jgi:DNA polymerase-3 subunit alpha